VWNTIGGRCDGPARLATVVLVTEVVTGVPGTARKPSDLPGPKSAFDLRKHRSWRIKADCHVRLTREFKSHRHRQHPLADYTAIGRTRLALTAVVIDHTIYYAVRTHPQNTSGRIMLTLDADLAHRFVATITK
jgi:hypothetical protein